VNEYDIDLIQFEQLILNTKLFLCFHILNMIVIHTPFQIIFLL